MKCALALSRRALRQVRFSDLRFKESTLLNKVLVVEDEQLLAENLQGYLQAQGLKSGLLTTVRKESLKLATSHPM